MEKRILSLQVNGVRRTVAVMPNQTLLEVLREELHLTGTKQGCGIGDCGSCTVLLDGKPVNSCLVLALQVEGSSVTTIEGVSEGKELHSLQKAFIEKGAVQCGFCTPGMILTSLALLREDPDPAEGEVRRAIAGNLCRCTGYQKIVEAVLHAAQEMRRGGKGGVHEPV